MNAAASSRSLTPASLGRGPVPTEPYREPQYFELERERIFRRTWLCVGREEEVEKPGDFIVREIEVVNASVIIVRETGGELRAFYNVCSHRSNKVVWEVKGHVTQFMCRYHNWSYALDGSLRGVPNGAMFFDLDKKKCGLSNIHVSSWAGFIFVHVGEAPEQPLLKYLGGIAVKLGDYPFSRFRSVARTTGELKANWKVAIDAFQEGYHVGALHRRTIGPQFTSRHAPAGRLLSAELFGPHRSASIWGNREFTPRPSELLAFTLGARIGAESIAGLDEVQIPASLNPSGDPNWAVEMNVIFPNVMVFVSRQGYILHRFWPTSVRTTRWEVSLHFAPPQTASQLFSQQFSVCAVRDTFAEDAANLDRSQRGIDSGIKTEFQFQDEEVLLRHQYRVVDAYVRGIPIPE